MLSLAQCTSTTQIIYLNALALHNKTEAGRDLILCRFYNVHPLEALSTERGGGRKTTA